MLATFAVVVSEDVCVKVPVPEVIAILALAATVSAPAKFSAPVEATKSVPAFPIFVMILVLASSVPFKVKAESVSVVLSKVIPPFAAIAPEAVRVLTVKIFDVEDNVKACE